MTARATVPSLGADLRALRKARGLTLEEVAQRLGCSVGWLSQAERGRSAPGIDSLRQLSEIYGVPVSLFFGLPPAHPEEAGIVVRAADRRVLGSQDDGLTEALLSPDLTDAFEVVHCRFAPHARLRRAVERPTQELVVVTAGSLRLDIRGDLFDLETGDSARIRGAPYRWANPHPTPCEAIWVIAPPVY